MDTKDNRALGEQYYSRFENGPLINDRFRKVAEKIVVPTVQAVHGRLDIYDLMSYEENARSDRIIAVIDHRSAWDIPYATAALREINDRTSIVVMKEHYIDKFYTLLFHKLGAIGVGRGAGDGPSLQQEMEKFIKLGYNGWYFGEETRVKHDTRIIKPIKSGAPRLSLATNVPIRTIGFAGLAVDDDRQGSRSPVIAYAGNYIYPSLYRNDQDPIESMSEDIRIDLQQNKDSAYQKWDLVRAA